MSDKNELPVLIDCDRLGIELARRLSWDGLDILLTARAALVDANFHREAKMLDPIIAEQFPL